MGYAEELFRRVYWMFFPCHHFRKKGMLLAEDSIIFFYIICLFYSVAFALAYPSFLKLYVLFILA